MSVEEKVQSLRDHGYSQERVEEWLDAEGLIESGQPLPSLTEAAREAGR